jgi:hypothetical protein
MLAVGIGPGPVALGAISAFFGGDRGSWMRAILPVFVRGLRVQSRHRPGWCMIYLPALALIVTGLRLGLGVCTSALLGELKLASAGLASRAHYYDQPCGLRGVAIVFIWQAGHGLESSVPRQAPVRRSPFDGQIISLFDLGTSAPRSTPWTKLGAWTNS